MVHRCLIFAAFVIAGFCNLGCATSIAAQYPHLERVAVCLRVPGVGSEETDWIYDENGTPISSANVGDVARVAPKTRRVFEFNPAAPPENVEYLPGDHSSLTCQEPFAVLPSVAVKEWLPHETLFFADEPLRQRAAEEQGCSPQVAAAYLGDITAAPKVYVKDKCMAPKAVSARERAILDVEKDLKKLGTQYGTVFGASKRPCPNLRQPMPTLRRFPLALRRRPYQLLRPLASFLARPSSESSPTTRCSTR